MSQFEYRTLKTNVADLAKDELVTRLDSLGAEGWKLVSTVGHQHHGYSHEVHMIFVRTKKQAIDHLREG